MIVLVVKIFSLKTDDMNILFSIYWEERVVGAFSAISLVVLTRNSVALPSTLKLLPINKQANTKENVQRCFQIIQRIKSRLQILLRCLLNRRNKFVLQIWIVTFGM